MTTSKPASSSIRFSALRVVLCCIISIGVICNFPQHLEVANAVSLRGRKLDNVAFSLPTNATVSLIVKELDDVAPSLPTNDAVSLSGKKLDDVAFSPPTKKTDSLSVKKLDDVASSLPTNDAVSLGGKKLNDIVATSLPTNDTRVASPRTHEDGSGNVKLDFFVAGFPKCGTTTLLKTFDAHNETSVHPEEECSLVQLKHSDDIAHTRLMNRLNQASSDPNVKRGIKCPFGLSTPTAIKRLKDWFPDAKLIFGLRHPVFYFQSFYNYRVLMVHQNKLQGPIPSPESLIGSNDWFRVSTDTARFEKTLKMLGKASSDDSPPTPFRVFLYTLEQMEDENEDRVRKWREALGSFLELKHQIQPLHAENVNRFQGENGFDETINICDTKYDNLRSVLVENGRKTQRWILEEFLKSPDVTVANAGHFNDLLQQWGLDPCVKGTKQSEK